LGKVKKICKDLVHPLGMRRLSLFL
jgi:hypothetical protein